MMIRTAQLRRMNEHYDDGKNGIVLLYGRDGCEKEALLRVYLQDKKHFYYRARAASASEQYRQMAAQTEETYGIKLTKGTYNEIFTRVKSGDASKLVVVIDEFQQIVKKAPDFMASIIKLKEKRLYPGPVQIILASSDLAWMEQNREEHLGVFADRQMLTIKLDDLTFLDVVRAFPDLPVAEVVRIHGVIGGVSSYVSRWSAKLDFKTNVCRHILSPYGYLHGEAERYLSLHLRELAVYETILAAIAAGHRKLNDLYDLTGFSRAKISVYLRSLMEIDVIEKAESFETGGVRNTQKGLYQIRDPLINFWFRFIYPHLSEVYMLGAEKFYDRYIAPEIETYMNRYFVQVCGEYLALMSRVHKLPIELTKQGTWIGKQGTIDIVAQDSVRNTIVGKCNWSALAMTAEDVRELLQTLKKARLSPKQIYLFTATEFDAELIAWADREEQLILIDMKQL